MDKDDLKTLKYKAYNVLGKASLWSGNDYSDKSIINESGLYSLILSSKLESAKTFKHCVTAEVLPTIRKTGGYINVKNPFLIRLSVYSEHRKNHYFLLKM